MAEQPPQRPSPQTPTGTAAPGAAVKGAYGLADRKVTADAAVAAGLAVEGDLAAESALRLFYLAAAAQASGRLVLGAQGQQFALTFKKGGVEHVLPEAPELSLGRFLVQKGKLKPEELAKAAQAGGDLVGALIAQRLVNPADVAALLQEHGAGLVTRALATEQGRFRWDPGVAPPASAFPLGNSWSFLCAAVRALDAAAVARRLGPRLGQAASRVGGRIRIEDLRLTPQEARAVQQFDGARAVQAVAAAAGADSLLVLRLALLLGDAELLAFAAPRPGAAPPPPPQAPAQPAAPSPAAAKPVTTPAPAPTPAKPATTPGPAAAKPAVTPAPAAAKPPAPAAHPPTAATKPAIPAARPPAPPKPAAAPAKPAATPAPAPAPGLDLATLGKLHEKLATADHFEVLGVKRDAAAGQIKIAYFQLAKVYHPDAVPADAPPELRKAAADVFAKVSEAWSVLGDEARRAAYLSGLATGANTEVDVMHIFKAEEAFNAGCLLEKARRYQEAAAKFEEAVKLNPDEAEFAIWKAWCEFLLSAEKKKVLGATSGAIEAALKKNARCVAGYLFLGRMAKITGDLALAEKQLRRGLKEAPGNADLEREVKYLRK